MKAFKLLYIFLALCFSLTIRAQEEKLPSFFNSETTVNESSLVWSVPQANFQFRGSEKTNSVVLKQIGDGNEANIQNKLALGEHKVYQLGEKNNYQFLNYSNGIDINLGVLQLGDSNHLKIVGSNSMSRGVVITQFGGSRLEMINF